MTALPIRPAGWIGPTAPDCSLARINAALHALWWKIRHNTRCGPPPSLPPDDEYLDEQAAMLIALVCATHC
jgi:hypothetical protein